MEEIVADFPFDEINVLSAHLHFPAQPFELAKT
jgi:hypothetical protein